MRIKKTAKFVIGIDEVGRGALAGPVVVVAAAVRVYAVSRIQNSAGMKLRDSKKLSARQREEWVAHFKICPDIAFSVARVYPRGIERMNISRAANLAALRACRRLVAKRLSLSVQRGLQSAQRSALGDTPVFLDGGLYLANGKWQTAHCPGAKTMVKADEKIPAVAVASVIAKVSRDRFMRRLAKKYPEYGFEAHKGYGTKAHYRALKKHGASPVHRLTFLKKRPIIGG
jgi:ribonuclease HII